MNKKIYVIFALLLCLVLSSCSTVSKQPKNDIAITDDLGNTCYLSEDPKVVACYGSFAECWLLAGGNLIGVTEDAMSEHNLFSDEKVSVVGTVKEINVETLLSLTPDYVILSADLTAHIALQPMLDSLDIAYGYFSVDTFEDYSSLMKQFCKITQRQDLYQKNVTDVKARIDLIRSKIPEDCDKTVLLMRAFSSGVKAKTDDNLAGQILKEFGVINIADLHPSLLEDISIESLSLAVRQAAQLTGLNPNAIGDVSSVMIPHIFLYPFYVQSYSTSATVALEIYLAELEQEGEGFGIYMDLLKRDDSSLTFEENLINAGLTSPFSKKHLMNIADRIHYNLLGSHYFKNHGNNNAA